MSSSKSIFEKANLKLKLIYPTTEASQIAFMLLEHLTSFSKIEVMLDKEITSFDEVKFENYLDRLLAHEPIQYVIGKAYFLDHEFNVNKHTLIPRPETEELVNLIFQENKNKSSLKIVDIGTGSGCIVISLNLQLPQNQYFGIDISKEAIKVAKENAAQLKASVEFEEADIFNIHHSLFSASKFDIIVSNPPYVLESDKIQMRKNVLDFEPTTALFVSDEKPLIYYEAIVQFAQKKLHQNGRLYFEIHESKGDEILLLMKKYQFYNAEIKNDFNNKARFAIGTFTPQ